MDVATAVANAKAVKGAFVILTALAMTAYKWPPHRPLQNGATCDYVIVGAGTAGSVLANRLTEDPSVSVCVVEAGGDPTFETSVPGAFPLLAKSSYDWDFAAEDDGYSAQYHKNKHVDLPAGKALGGSSNIHHLYHLRGDANDYNDWARTTGDESWSWQNLVPYFKRSESVKDEFILNSENGKYHGTNGPVGITRETREEPLKYMKAFEEIGFKINEDINGASTLGFTRPMFSIADGVRQDAATAYLSPIKDRENLYIMKNTLATKININSNKQATGIQCTDSNGNDITINARKEVIVSSGVFNTPKLLMLSGVGPKDHLESLGIPVVSNLPVGRNLQDHVAVVLIHKLQAVTETPAAENPSKFPLPTFVGFGAVNKSQSYPDFMTLNLITKNNPSTLMTLCTGVLGLNDNVCEQLSAAGVEREILFTVFNVARTKSTGKVLLRSTNPQDPPIINTGHLSNNDDVQTFVDSIEDFTRVTKSSYFKEVGGETLHFDLPNCSDKTPNTKDYWKCYVLNMMDTCFQYSSTASMGSVLDSNLRVKGVSKLRVVDGSSIPNLTSGELYPAVLALAEKASDLIKRA